MVTTLKPMAEVNLNFKIPDELHRRVRAAAGIKGLSVQAYIKEVLDRATEPLKGLEDVV